MSPAYNHPDTAVRVTSGSVSSRPLRGGGGVNIWYGRLMRVGLSCLKCACMVCVCVWIVGQLGVIGSLIVS